MKFTEFLSDKKSVLPGCFASALFFTVLLRLFGIGTGELCLLWLCFLVICGSFLLQSYVRQRKRFRYLQSVMDSLDQKYLFAEIADRPDSRLEALYFRLMKTAFKAMTDEVSQAGRITAEYRDFVEQWVHEMKVPISGIELLCENNRSEVTRKVMTQTEMIAQSVERVLFYARLGNVEKDYLISEVSLKACILQVLAENKQYLIQNNACISAESVSDTVYSDKKWLQFILNQIIINSVKYCGARPPVIEAVSHRCGNHVTLSITDHGIGIKESELSRVFDKGFVGSNGRTAKNATGIGLYLCHRLCAKLGIQIEIESKAEAYTTVLLHFPISYDSVR